MNPLLYESDNAKMISGDGAVGSVLVDCAGDASSNPSINEKGLYTVIN